MSNQASPTDKHMAEVRKNKRLSVIWLLPFIALCIGLLMLYQQWANLGPLITISMQSAQGLEANKTKIKTHNVDVGIVKNITLKKDSNGVLITARINKQAENLLVKDSQIWVVSPRISNTGISGLNTLLSGVYIELSPGRDSIRKTEFVALENPPVTPAGTPGMHIILTSREKLAYSIGDTVVYKGLTVGKFENVYFDLPNKRVSYDVFIEAPYHQLITKKTRFWDISGLEIDLSANGINIQTDSVQSLLSNSVTFDDFEDLVDTREAKQSDDHAFYDIYPDKNTAAAPNYTYSLDYIVLVSDSVRGLKIGAPVEFRGINVGEVVSINEVIPQDKPLLSPSYKIPVLISLQPGKIGLEDSKQSVEQLKTEHQSWIENGLRAKLKTGNIVTGQLFVELQNYPDLAWQETPFYSGYPVIPSVLNDFSSLTESAQKLLDKLNKLPLEALTENASNAVKTFNDVAKNLKTASTNLNIVLDDMNQQQVVSHLNSTLTATKQLADSYSVGSQTHQDLLQTLEHLNELLLSAQTLASNYSQGSETYDNLGQTLSRINTILLELQPLLLHLNQQPNSLIFSGKHPADIQPKARKE